MRFASAPPVTPLGRRLALGTPLGRTFALGAFVRASPPVPPGTPLGRKPPPAPPPPPSRLYQPPSPGAPFYLQAASSSFFHLFAAAISSSLYFLSFQSSCFHFSRAASFYRCSSFSFNAAFAGSFHFSLHSSSCFFFFTSLHSIALLRFSLKLLRLFLVCLATKVVPHLVVALFRPPKVDEVFLQTIDALNQLVRVVPQLLHKSPDAHVDQVLQVFQLALLQIVRSLELLHGLGSDFVVRTVVSHRLYFDPVSFPVHKI